MLTSIAVAVINHLLAREAWARERLAPFAGKHLAVSLEPLARIALTIGADGLVAAAPADAAFDLSATLPAAALPKFVGQRDALLADLHVSGNAELATAVTYVAQHLRWDAEDDLARMIGDIPTHRVAGAARSFAAWQRDAAQRLAANVSEYVSEEARIVVRTPQLRELADDIASTAAAIDSLEARIARLEHR
jgi:ubiquinone biosynthesis accessory factor UbiJ